MDDMTRPILIVVLLLATVASGADDYPQWLGPQRDNVYREGGVVEAFPPEGLKTLWRAPVGGGYSQVAVAGDRVVVTDRVKGAAPGPGRGAPRPGVERVLCLDDATGKELWRVEYDCPYTVDYGAGPRTTPTVDGDRVYTLGAEGHLYCIEIKTGQTRWSKKMEGKPTTWGYAGSPLIEGDLLIVLSSGRPLLTAMNKLTGEVVWTALEAKDPGYAPPTPMVLAGRRQIVQYHPFGVAGVDPKDGAVLWQLEYGPEQNGVAIVTPVQLSPDSFLLCSAWNGMAAVRVTADQKASFAWRVVNKGRAVSTIHSIHSQVVPHEGHLYGVHSTGALVCVDAATGRAVWSDTIPLVGPGAEKVQWGTGFLTPWRPDADKPARRFFLASDGGDLILCDLSPAGYKEVSRARVLDPTNRDAGRPTLWCHPAYAHRSVYWRNDRELVRVSLEAR
jgi:outer membrane protein assembly factor BamB